MRDLRELRLPRLVEARDNATLVYTAQSGRQSSTSSHTAHSPTVSDQPPVSPTFSLRSQLTPFSPSSPLASSPTMRSSLEDYSSKRPLTEVPEETGQERGDQFEMIDAFPRDFQSTRVEHHEELSISEYLERSTNSVADYDWVDTPPLEASDFDFAASKRHCADEPSSFNAIQWRISTRLPSLTRKWKSRKDQRSSSIPDSGFESTTTRSRASSMKSPSILDVKLNQLDQREPPTPLTPSQSGLIESSQHDATQPPDPSDHQEAYDEDARPKSLARTPLLPPVMALASEDGPVQSPLQSPTIAEAPSVPHSPFDCPSPYSGLPSPPLSTKPSIASFHHRPIIPSSEIPAIRLVELQDEWTAKLGHFNFAIEPEPYSLPRPTSLEDCKRLRVDWETARCNYVKHLARAAEVHSTTSTTYRWTEEKWAAIDATWKRNHEQGLASVPRNSEEELQASQHESDQVPLSLAKLPTFNGPQSEGKFPKANETGIIGPMEQVKPCALARPSRKRAFWRFLQGVLPSSVAFGRSQA